MHLHSWGSAVALCFLLSACDGGTDGSSSFDDEAEAFAVATCGLQSTCFDDDEAQCLADVRADMQDAKAALDDAGQQACIDCMRTKRVEGDKIVDANCDLSAGNLEAVYDACDLDPATDFNGDGTPDNDDDEACAGFP